VFNFLARFSRVFIEPFSSDATALIERILPSADGMRCVPFTPLLPDLSMFDLGQEKNCRWLGGVFFAPLDARAIAETSLRMELGVEY